MNTNRRLFLKYGAHRGAGVFASGAAPTIRAWPAADLAAQELRTTELSVTVQDRIRDVPARLWRQQTVGTPATFPDADQDPVRFVGYDCWEIIAERLPALIATNNVDRSRRRIAQLGRYSRHLHQVDRNGIPRRRFRARSGRMKGRPTVYGACRLQL